MKLPRYRLYILAVGAGFVALGVVCSGLALYLQPLSGDMTRLGGYTENDFGWNGDKTRFEPSLVRAGSLKRAYDVVVVGDSFSLPVELTPESPADHWNHWTDHFAAATGLAVGAFNRDRVSLETVLASDSFLKTPPKLLVVEYAERTLQWAPLGRDPQCVALIPLISPVLTTRPQSQQAVRYARDHGHGLSTERIDEAIDFLTKNVPRWMFKTNITAVSRHQLSRSGLFTNKNNDELLVFDDDLIKGTLSDAYLQSLACYFSQVQSRIEANHTTKFVLMIAPDRTTAYADYLPGLHLPNLTERLAGTTGLTVLRLDQVMKAAVLSGNQDVYYPSDTHWSPLGMALAAKSLIQLTMPSATLTQLP